MEVLSGLGMHTSAEEDVLGLAGIDLCGVGARRPQVYVDQEGHMLTVDQN